MVLDVIFQKWKGTEGMIHKTPEKFYLFSSRVFSAAMIINEEMNFAVEEKEKNKLTQLS